MSGQRYTLPHYKGALKVRELPIRQLSQFMTFDFIELHSK